MKRIFIIDCDDALAIYLNGNLIDYDKFSCDCDIHEFLNFFGVEHEYRFIEWKEYDRAFGISQFPKTEEAARKLLDPDNSIEVRRLKVSQKIQLALDYLNSNNSDNLKQVEELLHMEDE